MIDDVSASGIDTQWIFNKRTRKVAVKLFSRERPDMLTRTDIKEKSEASQRAE